MIVAYNINMTWMYEGKMVVIFNIIGWAIGEIVMTRVTIKEMPCGVVEESMTSSWKHIKGWGFHNFVVISF